MAELFGTDGIRGVSNQFLTGEFAFRLAVTMGELFRRENKSGEIFIGKDPRMSSDMLEHSMASGFMSVGFDVISVGIIPTAGLAYTTRINNGLLGVMISASHNQIIDNGIKFFDDNGMKLDQAQETAIENAFFDKLYKTLTLSSLELGSFEYRPGIEQSYIEHLVEVPKNSLDGLKVILDTAHGAASGYAQQVFKTLGADVCSIHDECDGRKINVDCGSNYPDIVCEMSRSEKAHMGVAFDGDADRAILIDENGNLVNGDQILAMWGIYLLDQKNLRNKTVVGTVLSNQGLEIVLNEHGGILVRTDVGDKYIMRKMIEEDYEIGGEQSGHIIFRDHFVTGDGITTALKVAELMKVTGEPLSKLSNRFVPFPQFELNVPTKDRLSWKLDDSLKQTIKDLEKEVWEKANGRVLVRESGTQPLIRVMVEAEDAVVAKSVAERMRDAIKDYLEKNDMYLLPARRVR